MDIVRTLYTINVTAVLLMDCIWLADLAITCGWLSIQEDMECSSNTTSTSSTFGTPNTLAPPMRRNLGPIRRGAPLSSQRRTLGQAQRGPWTGVGRGKSQAYNLTTEEAEASGEVVAGKALVHSFPVLSLVHHIVLYLVDLLLCILYPLYIWVTNEKLVRGMV